MYLAVSKWNRFWKNKCWNKFRCSCIHQNNLTDMETLRNIDIHLVSLLLTLKWFHSFSKYFIVEFGKCFWLYLATEIKVETSKNYKACKHGYKLCHINQTGQSTTWKKPVLNLKSMQIVSFEQTSTKFIEIIVL